MSLRFLGQPFEDATQIGRVLNAALRDQAMTNLWLATAWAKQSGLSRIRSAVLEFKDNGGTCEVIVGIDEGGATREGLQLCLELFEHAFVYHDPGTRTFHPKFYAVENDEQALVIVGSGNLTKGGLFTNYEAALVFEAARQDAADWQVRDDVRAYFDRLLIAGDAIRHLDEDLIQTLEDEGWVVSEARQNARRSAGSRERRQRQALFGGPVAGLAGAPAPEVPPLPDEEDDEDSALPLAAPPAAPPVTSPAAPASSPAAAPAAPTVVASWDKVMRRADAQQPANPNTNPTGLLRLSQEDHDIDHRTWFRHVLFGTALWAPRTDREGNAIEIATVPMDVTMGGVSHGTVNVVVDHAPHREEGQGNVLSILHWGPTLGPLLRATDYHGRRVTISHMSDGSYRLEIV